MSKPIARKRHLMSKTGIGLVLYFAATLAAGAGAPLASAAADTPPVSSLGSGPVTPPSITTQDAYAVDLSSGDISYSKVLVTIGADGTRQLTATYTNFPGDDENVGAINYSGDQVMGVMSYKVSIGSETEIFSGSPGSFVAANGMGSTLTYDSASNTYSYTKRDGTVAVFAKSMGTGAGARPHSEGLMQSLTYPTGEKLTYYWKNIGTTAAPIWHLSAVVSNRGLMIKYSGLAETGTGITVTAVNLSADYCDPLAETCTGLTQAWPSANLGVSSSSTSSSGSTGYYTIVHPITNALGKLASRTYWQSVTSYGADGPYSSGGSSSDTKAVVTITNEIGNTKVVTYKDRWTNTLTSDFTEGKISSVVAGDTINRAYSYTPAGGLHQPWMGQAAYASPGPNGSASAMGFHLASSYVFEVSPVSSTSGGNTTNYTRDSYDRITQETRPEGDNDVYTYDSRGNVTQIAHKAKPNTFLGDITYQATYPATCTNPKTCNEPTATFDAKGNETDYTYDANSGLVLTVTAPAGASGIRPQTRYTYSALYAQVKTAAGTTVNAASPIYVLTGTSICTTQASCAGTSDERTTSVTYSSNLYPATVTTAGNGVSAVITKAYSGLGDVTVFDGPRTDVDGRTYKTYDLLRRPVFETGVDPDGAGLLLRSVVRHVYDDAGQEIRTDTGVGQATDGSDFVRKSYVANTYNNSGLNIRTAKFIDGVATPVSVTDNAYDAAGRLTCSAVRMNPASFLSAPSDACTPGTAGTFGPDRITKTTYDTADEVTEVDQGVGTAAPRAYGRYSYTANGLKQTETDANGNKTTYVFDGFDRLSQIQYPSTVTGSGNSNTGDYEAFSYDPNGNVVSDRRRDGQVVNDCFDALDRIIVHYVHAQSGCTATGGAKDVYTSYDLFGDVLSKRFASNSGAGVTYSYDGLGRVLSTSDMNGRTLNYQYNQAGARTRLTYPDGVYFNFTLDAANRATELRKADASLLYSLTYDDLGRRTKLTRTGTVATAYAYDNLGRLTNLTNTFNTAASNIGWGFAYTPAGQIDSWSASTAQYDYTAPAGSLLNQTYDGLNRDASIAAMQGGYDARGNLTTDGPRAFTYDIENRLLTATGGSAPLTLAYDPEGRLSSYTSGTTTTQFVYDGINLVGEYNSAGAMTERYAFGPASDEPIVQFDGPSISSWRYFWQNYQGSVVAMSDNAGNFQELYKYDPYGVPTNSFNTSAWAGVRFRYTGQLMLWEPRLYYYKARVYDPSYGHFLQTDPIGSQDDLDLYEYVKDDPVNNTDPSGHSLLEAVFIIGDAAQLANDLHNHASGWQVAGDVAFLAFDVASTAAPVPGISEAAHGAQALVHLAEGGAHAAEAAHGAEGAGHAAQAAEHPHCCFVAGTLVSTKDGLRPIEEIKVGDLVLSKDPVTGSVDYKAVTALIKRHDREIYKAVFEVTDAKGGQEQVIYRTTSDHPWRTADGKWVATEDLRKGAHISRANGSDAVVDVIENTHTIDGTYNLEVADYHTYFVGGSELWVHNSCYGEGTRKSEYGNPSSSKAAQDARTGGEGKPCPSCGKTMKSGTATAPQAQHHPALSDHYNQHGGSKMTSAQRREYARSQGSISGAQCKTCQQIEGRGQQRKYRSQ